MMNATERDALKQKAVIALRHWVGKAESADDLLWLAKKIRRAPDAIGRYLTGHSFPTPAVARRILAACAKPR